MQSNALKKSNKLAKLKPLILCCKNHRHNLILIRNRTWLYVMSIISWTNLSDTEPGPYKIPNWIWIRDVKRLIRIWFRIEFIGTPWLYGASIISFSNLWARTESLSNYQPDLNAWCQKVDPDPYRIERSNMIIKSSISLPFTRGFHFRLFGRWQKKFFFMKLL